MSGFSGKALAAWRAVGRQQAQRGGVETCCRRARDKAPSARGVIHEPHDAGEGSPPASSPSRLPRRRSPSERARGHRSGGEADPAPMTNRQIGGIS